MTISVSRNTQLWSVFRQCQRKKYSASFVPINLSKGTRDFDWQELGMEVLSEIVCVLVCVCVCVCVCVRERERESEHVKSYEDLENDHFCQDWTWAKQQNTRTLCLSAPFKTYLSCVSLSQVSAMQVAMNCTRLIK